MPKQQTVAMRFGALIEQAGWDWDTHRPAPGASLCIGIGCKDQQEADYVVELLINTARTIKDKAQRGEMFATIAFVQAVSASDTMHGKEVRLYWPQLLLADLPAKLAHRKRCTSQNGNS